MRIYHLLCYCLIAYSSIAQKTEAYYDFYWKPCAVEAATYYSTVEKTDSGWLRNDYYLRTGRLQMRALYEDKAEKIQNGDCIYFHANGMPSTVGRFVHGRREGICTRYHNNGMISDSALYHNGEVVDYRWGWHANGFMSDSIHRINDSTCVEVGWFEEGNLAYAGHLVHDKQEGKWKYYHHNGKLSSTEIYKNGKLTEASYLDDNGSPVTDTSNVNNQATFKGGEKAWIKYLEKKLYWPPNLEFTTSGAVTVGITFAVDENGKVVDADVSMPFHKAFDKIALDIVKSSPAWQPAVSHNRKVKAYRIQPVTFVQPE